MQNSVHAEHCLSKLKYCFAVYSKLLKMETSQREINDEADVASDYDDDTESMTLSDIERRIEELSNIRVERPAWAESSSDDEDDVVNEVCEFNCS